ncbi:type III secretion system stator protein SctL [Chromobacterium violaceum]|uniref:Probable type III secretion protein n=1 Tax=Chromobacterium violaceum (strain ATCC 12472 / DSM 30191 / JCM 1249 / CCUG 213 / NBRC 12614 / NCIMB 9131 / NCTC 9757 / MK) TaxID=243365 RepID=Q7NUV3_CHRVO|nr:type III secretion system stator protein SctL [Chromobacterium violaceum]AAQ60264.2 probable type III secretion protein [Chromobacterium violaceum ATCC 12472]SUX35792.1 type III secretion system protein [Chromobacterium violaceum]
MTLLSLPITKLPGNAPLGPIIPAGDLADYIEASEIIEQAREQAKSIIQDGEKKIENLCEMYEEISEAAWQDGLKNLEQQAPALRQQAVANVVEWLIAEQELEHKIIERLEGQLCDILIKVFKEYYGQQNESQLLINLLRERVRALLDSEEGVLYVCPEQYEELKQALISFPKLLIESDASIMAGKALLQTPLVILSLSLNEQFDWAISRLFSHSHEMWQERLLDCNIPQQGELSLFPKDFIEARGGNFMSVSASLGSAAEPVVDSSQG